MRKVIHYEPATISKPLRAFCDDGTIFYLDPKEGWQLSVGPISQPENKKEYFPSTDYGSVKL